MRFSLLLSILGVAFCSKVPTGLLCDFQRHPALGVRAIPHFTWIVPPCGSGSDHQQTGYQIIVSGVDGKKVWDSGKVDSSDSTYVAYAGPALKSGTQYRWIVSTWTAAASSADTTPCKSSSSSSATFVTSLFDGWSSSAQWLGLGKSATFAYFRKEVNIPSGVVSASAFVTAQVDNNLLSGYKFYIDGHLVNIGPGRGEAPVWDGDGEFRSLPYTTLDVTEYFSSSGKKALALQTMDKKPAVMLQINLKLKSGENITIGTDSTWMAFNGDVHRKPGAPQHGHSAGTGYLEYIDARQEPVGWEMVGFKGGSEWSPAAAAASSSSQAQNLHAKMGRPMQVTNIAAKSIKPIAPSPGPAPSTPVACGLAKENEVLKLACPGGTQIEGISFASFGTPGGSCPGKLTKNSKCDSNKTLDIVTKACVGQTGCSVKADRNVFGDPCYDVVKALAVELRCPAAPPGPAPPPAPPGPKPKSYLVDFGREFQGGLRLSVQDGKAGQTAHLACGESISGDKVGSTWGWEFDWTLRDGAQVLEQHKYMECRFVTLDFPAGAPSNFSLSAWKVHYEWYDDDTHFDSSNKTLNAVWELSRYTLEAASLDTYTDSNTRERRPYEADGGVAATARLMVQREYMWARHSHAWVIQNPTWPVEWKQLTPFLGWQDYMATGQTDLSQAFLQQMYDRTMIKYLDATGLLDTSKMGRHIVDWMPYGGETDQTVALGEFTASNHMSVSNAFCAHGLELLSQMAAAAGLKENATDFASKAASLKQAMVTKMWNGTAFCDGVCEEVKGKSLMMTNMFTLLFGMIPEKNVASVWHTVADWGLEKIGDYGAFMYLNALSSSYYAPLYSTPDDGSAVLTALTKCDEFSWCSGLRDDNLTITRESWHHGTYSHPWGTGAVPGVIEGIMGVHQTAPGFATFTVKPKLGALAHAEVTVPTLRGYVSVTAAPTSLKVDVPCNTIATLCLPRSSQDSLLAMAPETTVLLLDDHEVPATADAGHLCAQNAVSCGNGGAPRVLVARPRITEVLV